MDELDRREIAHIGLQRRASATKRSRRAQDAKRLATPNARSGLRKGRVLRKFFCAPTLCAEARFEFSLCIGAQSGSETLRLRFVDFAARVALKPHCQLTPLLFDPFRPRPSAATDELASEAVVAQG